MQGAEPHSGEKKQGGEWEWNTDSRAVGDPQGPECPCPRGEWGGGGRSPRPSLQARRPSSGWEDPTWSRFQQFITSSRPAAPTGGAVTPPCASGAGSPGAAGHPTAPALWVLIPRHPCRYMGPRGRPGMHMGSGTCCGPGSPGAPGLGCPPALSSHAAWGYSDSGCSSLAFPRAPSPKDCGRSLGDSVHPPVPCASPPGPGHENQQGPGNRPWSWMGGGSGPRGRKDDRFQLC